MVINSVAFKRKHNIPVSEGLSLKEIAKLSKMPEKALLEVKKGAMPRLAHHLVQLDQLLHQLNSGLTEEFSLS